MAKRAPRTKEQKLHAAIITAAGVLAVAMVAAAAWSLTRPLPPGALPDLATETVDATSSASATSGAVPATQAPVVPVQPTAPASVTPTAVPVAPAGRRIGFHIGGTLYLASEDGKNKTPMYVTGTNYALSPDGKTVAAVDGGKFFVAEVGTHLLANSPSTPGLAAEAVPPVWTPDSSAVLFVRADKDGTPHVWVFNRATATTSEFSEGSGAAISPNGSHVAVLPAADNAVRTISVAPLASGAKTSFKVPSGDPVAIALGANRVFVSTVAATGNSSIWAFDYNGANKKQLVASSLTSGTEVTYGNLILSPNGSKLLFSADGDDGYSRLWTVPVAGGKATKISGRRDGYAVAWTRDSKNVLFIEGNAFQGQVTALWKSDLTGSHRTKLVEGATL
jgi:Tol biopolymer transport system component